MTGVRVATFNVRTSSAHDGRHAWRWRRRACVDIIRGLDADVVGLQEVRPDQLRHLRSAFPDATLLGDGRDADGGGEHATVLVAQGWTVDTHETRWLSPTPDRPGSTGWGATLPRVVTIARLSRGPARIAVANTHLDHRSDEVRGQQVDLLTGWLASGMTADRPWVVLGDLNTDPGTAPLRTLAAAGFVDTLRPDAGGTEHAFTGAVDRRRIDYVLAGPGLAVRSAWIDHRRPHGTLPSDHWPVVAELTTSPVE